MAIFCQSGEEEPLLAKKKPSCSALKDLAKRSRLACAMLSLSVSSRLPSSKTDERGTSLSVVSPLHPPPSLLSSHSLRSISSSGPGVVEAMMTSPGGMAAQSSADEGSQARRPSAESALSWLTASVMRTTARFLSAPGSAGGGPSKIVCLDRLQISLTSSGKSSALDVSRPQASLSSCVTRRARMPTSSLRSAGPTK